MGKLVFSLFFLGYSFCFAQSKQAELLYPANTMIESLPAVSSFCDTSSNLNFLTDTAVVFKNTGTGNWGYVSGTNSYKDISKAEKYFSSSYTSGYQLAGGIFYFAKAKDGNDSSQMSIAAWKDDGVSGYPKTLLGSRSFYIRDQTEDTLQTILFSQPIPVSGNFYLGLDGFNYDSPQSDTVVLYTSTKNVFSNTAFERWVDSTWHAFDEPNNWNFKSRFFIAALLCNTDVGSYEIINSSQEPLIFPNPANGKIFFHFGNGIAFKNKVVVKDGNGKTVLSELMESVNSTQQIDISCLSSGFYVVEISTPFGNFIRKLIVH